MGEEGRTGRALGAQGTAPSQVWRVVSRGQSCWLERAWDGPCGGQAELPLLEKWGFQPHRLPQVGFLSEHWEGKEFVGFKEPQLLSYDYFKSGLKFLFTGISVIAMKVVPKTSLVSWRIEIMPFHPQPGVPLGRASVCGGDSRGCHPGCGGAGTSLQNSRGRPRRKAPGPGGLPLRHVPDSTCFPSTHCPSCTPVLPTILSGLQVSSTLFSGASLPSSPHSCQPLLGSPVPSACLPHQQGARPRLQLGSHLLPTAEHQPDTTVVLPVLAAPRLASCPVPTSHSLPARLTADHTSESGSHAASLLTCHGWLLCPPGP